jgi:DNA-binding PadR family transcriptional regulator
VEHTTGFRLNNNSLYPALRRFEEAGAVTSTEEPQEGRPPRLVYTLTTRGRHPVLDARHRAVEGQRLPARAWEPGSPVPPTWRAGSTRWLLGKSGKAWSMSPVAGILLFAAPRSAGWARAA